MEQSWCVSDCANLEFGMFSPQDIYFLRLICFSLSKLTLGSGITSAVVGRGFRVLGLNIDAHGAGQLRRGMGGRCHLHVSGTGGGGVAILIGEGFGIHAGCSSLQGR